MIVYLPKMTLWRSADITTYPRCLARWGIEEIYTLQEVLNLFGVSPMLPLRRRHALRDIHRNIWDVEPRNGGIVLRGVCLVERSGDGFQMTTRAKALVASYRRNQDGMEWQEMLASILVDYDVRLRVVLYLLGTHSYVLTMRPRYRLYSQEKEQREEYVLFHDSKPNLNTLLFQWRDHLIGDLLWQRIERVGLNRAMVQQVVGLRGGQPALESHSFIQEVRLLLRLGVLDRSERGLLTIAEHRARQIFSAESFSELICSDASRTFLNVLRSVYQRMKDSDGFVVYNYLKEAVEREINEKSFDLRLQRAIEEQEVLIVQHAKGLRGNGAGFLGDAEFQRLQLAFN